MWGQANPTNLKDIADRIIPTRVGTSAPSHNSPTALKGSSPRVWGQALPPLVSVRLSGIIPTRVGTSGFFYNFSVFVKDHPHAYGDKFFFILCHWKFIGSSPRVWGQAQRKTFSTLHRGIIPTRMGTRSL